MELLAAGRECGQTKSTVSAGGKVIAHPRLPSLCEFAEGKLVKD